MSEQTPQQPLWSDDRVIDEVTSDPKTFKRVMQVVFDYEAERAQLAARVASLEAENAQLRQQIVSAQE